VPYCQIDDDEKARFALAPGDIVVARTGATVGYAKLIREEVDAVFASYLVRFRVDADKADPAYVGRLVESQLYKSFVLSRIGGAAQPNASAPVLGSFEFTLPARKSQSRISSILSAYDDLIENNRRRMGLLEEAARQLYREWFVRLRFPGHERVKIKDGLPEGWERKTLGAHVILNYGKSLKEDERVLGSYPVYGSSGIIGNHEKALAKGPGIIVGRKGNIGSIYWCSTDFWPIDTVYFIKPESSNLYLFYALQQMQFISTDVAVPGLNRDFAYSRKLLVPSGPVLREFLDSVGPIHAQLDTLTAYNQKLRAARDLLLPKLMSGEIAV
jgi:type I restriction enzyme S subunit